MKRSTMRAVKIDVLASLRDMSDGAEDEGDTEMADAYLVLQAQLARLWHYRLPG